MNMEKITGGLRAPRQGEHEKDRGGGELVADFLSRQREKEKKREKEKTVSCTK